MSANRIAAAREFADAWRTYSDKDVVKPRKLLEAVKHLDELLEEVTVLRDRATLALFDSGILDGDAEPPDDPVGTLAVEAKSLARKASWQAEEIAQAAEKLRKSETIRNELTAALRDVTMNPKSDDSRASGRTTRLILRGLIALSEGQKVIVLAARSVHAKNLRSRILLFAKEHGIPVSHGDILSGTFGSERTGFRGVTLIDHYAIEQIEAKP
jgi:hypothetical protein